MRERTLAPMRSAVFPMKQGGLYSDISVFLDSVSAKLGEKILSRSAAAEFARDIKRGETCVSMRPTSRKIAALVAFF